MTDFHDWLIVGTHWILCKASVVMGKATVITYDGRRASGIARRGLYGWLVVAEVKQ